MGDRQENRPLTVKELARVLAERNSMTTDSQEALKTLQSAWESTVPESERNNMSSDEKATSFKSWLEDRLRQEHEVPVIPNPRNQRK